MCLVTGVNIHSWIFAIVLFSEVKSNEGRGQCFLDQSDSSIYRIMKCASAASFIHSLVWLIDWFGSKHLLIIFSLEVYSFIYMWRMLFQFFYSFPLPSIFFDFLPQIRLKRHHFLILLLQCIIPKMIHFKKHGATRNFF